MDLRDIHISARLGPRLATLSTQTYLVVCHVDLFDHFRGRWEDVRLCFEIYIEICIAKEIAERPVDHFYGCHIVKVRLESNEDACAVF